MSKEGTKLTNEPPKDGSTATRTPVRMKQVTTPRTDRPEYIKAEELQYIFPFTIFSVSGPHASRFGGDRFKFGVAWKEQDGSVTKRVLTLTANEDRTELAFNVRKHGAIINCRITELQLGGDYTYWKIHDADEVPEGVIDTSSQRQQDIPFA